MWLGRPGLVPFLGLVPAADGGRSQEPILGCRMLEPEHPLVSPCPSSPPAAMLKPDPKCWPYSPQDPHARMLLRCVPVVAEVCGRGLSLYQSTKCLPLEGIQAGRFPQDLENPGIKLWVVRQPGYSDWTLCSKHRVGLSTCPGGGGGQLPRPTGKGRLLGTLACEGSWATPSSVLSLSSWLPMSCPALGLAAVGSLE